MAFGEPKLSSAPDFYNRAIQDLSKGASGFSLWLVKAVLEQAAHCSLGYSVWAEQVEKHVHEASCPQFGLAVDLHIHIRGERVVDSICLCVQEDRHERQRWQGESPEWSNYFVLFHPRKSNPCGPCNKREASVSWGAPLFGRDKGLACKCIGLKYSDL